MHTAKELHDEQCFREWLAHWRDHAANAPVVNGYWQRIERALSLLASVEDGEGIVRGRRMPIVREGGKLDWLCDHEGDYLEKIEALWAAYIALKAELASVKAENSKLRSALSIVHFKQELWQ